MELAYIAVALFAGLAVRRLGLPPLVGFLLAGFGLRAAGHASTPDLERYAAAGVTLLLFSIGLKLEPRELGTPAIWAGGGLCMLVSTLAGAALVLGLASAGVVQLGPDALEVALLLGFALSFSSTVVAVKLLDERGESRALHGRVAVGVLIVQDLAAVAYLAIAADKTPTPWALLLLGEWLPSRAIAPLLQRLFTEKDPVIQRMVRNNLRGYRKRAEFHKLLQFLRDNLRSTDQHRLQKAIFFLGDLRIAEAVPDLIGLLNHEETAVRESALFALRNLALQDFGINAEGWQEWHQLQAHLDRKHWVVDALNHSEKAIRHLAKEELRVEFGDDFGYDPNASTAEREAVQKLAGLWLQSN